MTWLAWRLYRTQVLVVLGVVGAIAIVLGVTGPHLVHLYDTTVATCAAHNDCSSVQTSFASKDSLLQDLGPAMLLVPALLGIFWGAPLVARELETGSYKVAWTQSVSRARWIVTKLVLLGLVVVLVAGLLSLMVTWWSNPFDRLAGNTMSPSHFDRRDLVPIGYALYAFALGTAFGTVIRRTLPAMAATLVGFILTRYAVLAFARPHFMAPKTLTTALQGFGGPGFAGLQLRGPGPSDWVIAEQTINRAGQAIGQNGGFGANGEIDIGVSSAGRLHLSSSLFCPNKVTVPGPARTNGPPPASLTRGIQECISKLDLRQVFTYQPSSRYWPFQIDETILFVVLAAALAAGTVWWVRRRLS